MIRGLSGSKPLAAFVLAFLCLNAAGALCLTWCLQGPATAIAASDDSHLSEHCRQIKRQAEQANKDRSSIEAAEAACCMMPVALFGAPVEKRVELAKVVALTPAMPVVEAEFAPQVVAYQHAHAAPVYRPPPLDRRVTRLLNCVIRI